MEVKDAHVLDVACGTGFPTLDIARMLGQGAQNSGYGSTKDGQQMTEALIKAFNALTAQGSALVAMMPPPPPPPAPVVAAPVAPAVTTVKKP